MTTEELIELQKEIEEAKTELAELKGQEKAILQTLKKDFGVKTIHEATVEIKELEKSLKKLTAQKNKIISKIEDAYEFDE